MDEERWHEQVRGFLNGDPATAKAFWDQSKILQFPIAPDWLALGWQV